MPLGKHNVGMPDQLWRLEAVGETQLVVVTGHDHLRLHVLRPNPAHDLASLFWGDGVHICFSK